MPKTSGFYFGYIRKEKVVKEVVALLHGEDEEVVTDDRPAQLFCICSLPQRKVEQPNSFTYEELVSFLTQYGKDVVKELGYFK